MTDLQYLCGFRTGHEIRFVGFTGDSDLSFVCSLCGFSYLISTSCQQTEREKAAMKAYQENLSHHIQGASSD